MPREQAEQVACLNFGGGRWTAAVGKIVRALVIRTPTVRKSQITRTDTSNGDAEN